MLEILKISKIRQKKNGLKPEVLSRFSGEPSEIRTPDNLIKSQVLCQLS